MLFWQQLHEKSSPTSRDIFWDMWVCKFFSIHFQGQLKCIKSVSALFHISYTVIQPPRVNTLSCKPAKSLLVLVQEFIERHLRTIFLCSWYFESKPLLLKLFLQLNKWSHLKHVGIPKFRSLLFCTDLRHLHSHCILATGLFLV